MVLVFLARLPCCHGNAPIAFHLWCCKSKEQSTLGTYSMDNANLQVRYFPHYYYYYLLYVAHIWLLCSYGLKCTNCVPYRGVTPPQSRRNHLSNNWLQTQILMINIYISLNQVNTYRLKDKSPIFTYSLTNQMIIGLNVSNQCVLIFERSKSL